VYVVPRELRASGTLQGPNGSLEPDGGFLLDTGATSTFIPPSAAEQLGIHPTRQVTVETASGVERMGVAEATLNLDGRMIHTPVLITSKGQGDFAVGLDAIEQLGILGELPRYATRMASCARCVDHVKRVRRCGACGSHIPTLADDPAGQCPRGYW